MAKMAEEKGSQWWKAALAIVGVVVFGVWSYAKSASMKPGSSGNNGVTGSFPAPPPSMMKAMERMQKDPPNMEGRDMNNPADQEHMRKEMEKRLTPEEREEMRKMMGEMQERMKKTQAVIGQQQMRQLMMRMSQRFRPPGSRPPGGGAQPPAPKP